MPYRWIPTAKFLAVVLCLVVLAGCPAPDYAVDLLISPSPLDFGTSATSMTLTVAKVYTGRAMQPFKATSTTPWIAFTPDTGISTGPSDKVALAVRIDRSQLVEGDNTGEITIACPGIQDKIVTVKAKVLPNLPEASFEADGTRVVVGDTVQFTDKSRPATGGTITSRIWDFGDGASSTLENPIHVYTASGAYNVTLFISTTNGNRTTVRNGYITAFDKRPLDAFVRTADSNYTYSVPTTYYTGDAFVYVVNMTSQKWRTSAEVSAPIWNHWMVVSAPLDLKTDTAVLFVSGGSSSSGGPDDATLTLLWELSVQLNAVVALVDQVPNQPLMFAGETEARSEDEIIAYTFDKYMTTGDQTWPALFPMVKSVVRAMDTVQSIVIAKKTKAAFSAVNHFVVSGASKRGWTTWLTSVTDSRVVATVPMVIDVLNMQMQMNHQFQAYGRYSDAVQDYVNLDIFSRFNTAAGQNLLQLVDPYRYLERLDYPKLIINSTGDQFFLPDSPQFYYHSLPGNNFLRFIPNTDHSLLGYDQVLADAVPIFRAAVNGTRAPKYSWVNREDGAIVVTIGVGASDKPSSVKLWQATNANARDFRLESIGAAWTSTELQPDANGAYVGLPTAPAKGWTAYMVELTIPSADQSPFVFTTEVRVTPDTLPYAPPS